ncbi:MAG: TolC family protein [Burkholderiales bacterium]
MLPTVWIGVCVVSGAVLAQSEVSGRVARGDSAVQAFTLDQAWRRAESHSAAIQAVAANAAAVEGQLADAQAFLWNNPQLNSEFVHRRVPQPEASVEWQQEWGVGISQTFETGGQQQHRRAAANADIDAQRLALTETRRGVRGEVEQRFVSVLSLQERIVAEEQARVLLDDAARLVDKRVAAGEDTRLDGNLAAIEATRQRNQVTTLREQLLEAQGDLAKLLQLPPNVLPEAVGSLDPRTQSYSLDELLALASARPQLETLRARERAAASRLDLERAAVSPDVTVGLGVGREGANNFRENLVGLTISVPLPFFRHNKTAIGKASTDLAQVRTERQASERDIPALVRLQWQRVESLRERVRRLETAVIAPLDMNRQLSSKAFSAGEIGLLQLVLVNRQMLEGQRDLLAARTELRMAAIALESAAGWLPPDRR